MASPTLERDPSTPPPAPHPGRTRKPSAKVLEAQRSLRTRTTTRSQQTGTGTGTAAVQPPHHEEHPNTSQLVQYELPAYAAEQSSLPVESGGQGNVLQQLMDLIVGLRETIAQQSNVIANQNSTMESIRSNMESNMEGIKAEQQYLKNQNAELQETIGSLRAQLDMLSVSPPSTQRTWASVAASGELAGSGTSLARTASSNKRRGDQHRQLVIDTSRAGEETVERVGDTEAAKQAILQGSREPRSRTFACGARTTARASSSSR
ncbi:hypothetical protein DM02DRAFT_266394 [Periconia macrospinosa]|uniref:Uncharacterized protein n=1 Tax=Periconia macrospinosa TaxID=97972 RepID=A0A2V1D432_9PLEO|nr:hypothetical protein DM02DRAFT_266394 [Periconia macrospinosa]